MPMNKRADKVLVEKKTQSQEKQKPGQQEKRGEGEKARLMMKTP